MSEHTSVLLRESIDALAIKPGGVYVDATFGRGGHSREILAQLGPKGRLIAIDKDLTAINFAEQAFAGDDRFTIVHSSFAQLEEVATANYILGEVDGILMDLGVSSPQLDNSERGFSFMQSGPLDMRMNSTQALDAATFVNQASEQQLADVIYQYGEERYSRRIAKAIIAARTQQAISTTLQLANIIKEAHPKWEKHKHPATRTFQAIRIFINNELDELQKALEQTLKVLKIGGRLAVISFHSLEDRLVKQFMQREATGPELPRYLPVAEAKSIIRLKRIGKAIKPSADELQDNIRSRSAVLRVAEKIN
jgi:16S rRNA (cytosine1402-N4)-methyltransferase